MFIVFMFYLMFLKIMIHFTLFKLISNVPFVFVL